MTGVESIVQPTPLALHSLAVNVYEPGGTGPGGPRSETDQVNPEVIVGVQIPIPFTKMILPGINPVPLMTSVDEETVEPVVGLVITGGVGVMLFKMIALEFGLLPPAFVSTA